MTTAEVLCLAVLNIGMPRAEYACEHMEELVLAAEQNSVRPELVVSMIYYESRWNPKVVSKSSACGLMQVMPKYSGSKKLGLKKLTCKQLKEPITNIKRGTRIISYWLNQYTRGNERVAVCSYFAGYRCRGKKPNAAGMRYSKKVRKFANKIKREMDKQERCKLMMIEDDDYYGDPPCDC